MVKKTPVSSKPMLKGSFSSCSNKPAVRTGSSRNKVMVPLKSGSVSVNSASGFNKFPYKYDSLDIPESMILQNILMRDGVFNFNVYQYPEGVNPEELSFYKQGSNFIL